MKKKDFLSKYSGIAREVLESLLDKYMNTGIYGLQAYKLAMQNTNYNKEGKAVISSADEWNDESEWDDMFEQMKKERGVK